MLRKILLLTFGFVIFSQSVFADTLLFVGEGCPFCSELRTSLSQKDFYNKFKIKEYEIFYNQENKNLYLEKSKELGYSSGQVPLLITGNEYFEGKDQILSYFEGQENKNFSTTKLDETSLSELNEIVEDFKAPKTNNPPQEQENNFWTIAVIILIGISTATAPFFWRRFLPKQGK